MDNYYGRLATITCTKKCVHNKEGFCMFCESSTGEVQAEESYVMDCVAFIEAEEVSNG